MFTASNGGGSLMDLMPKQVPIVFQNGLNRMRARIRKIKETIENDKPALTRAKSCENMDVHC